MAEMQPDDYVEESDFDQVGVEETQEAEDQDEGLDPDSSPGSGGTQKQKVVFSEEQQRIFDQAIAEKTLKFREAERRAEALEREREKLLQQMPKEQRPQVPEMPDPFAISDEEYRRAVTERDERLKQAAAYDAQQRYLHEQQERMAEERRLQQQEALNSKIAAYASRATKMGIKPEELQVAGATVSNFGIQNDLVNFIIEDEQGPLITKYLSQNLMELENIRNLSPMEAAIRIATEIKPKAVALKRKVNQAPDPVETPQGAGISPKPRGPSGATFE